MTRSDIKIGLGLDVGNLLSSARQAEGALSSITDKMREMEEARSKGDTVDENLYGQLAFHKMRMEAQNSGFGRDIKSLASNPNTQTTTANGATVLKMDSEYATRLRDIGDSLKKLYAQADEQLRSGESTTETFSQIDKLQNERHKVMKEATAPELAQAKAMKNSMGALVFGQIANSINEGLKIWANSLDRSGIVSAYGSGDILGGRIADKQRTANIVGCGAQTLLGTAGGIATALGNPLLGIGLSAAGAGVNTLAQALVSPEKNEAAYAGLWQQRSADAMNLAALTGDPKLIRKAFGEAADAAAKFGYSAEEGMEAMKQAARH